MTERRTALRQQARTADAELGKIEAVEPPPLPVLQNRWVLAGVLLFIAVMEAILTNPALGAIPAYAGDAQWLIAILVGLLLAAIVLVTGKALAYVIKHSDHRNTNRYYRFAWRTVSGLATLGVVCILILPVLSTISIEDNMAVFREMGMREMEQVDETSGLSVVLAWTLVLQLAALIAGLISSTLWALGEEYRRYAKLFRVVEEARAQLEELPMAESAKVEHEISAATFRYYEFLRYRERGAASVADGQKIPLVEAKPPDRDHWLRVYYSMAGGAALPGEP